MKTIEQVKAWMTQGLLIVVGWFVIDMKNDVKILLERTAKLETRVEYEHELRREKTARMVKFKGMELIFDRNKKLYFLPNQKFDYV